jgi:SAM-dependent methyltransferase
MTSASTARLGLFEYLLRRKTPIRSLEDAMIEETLSTIEGTIVELGALGDGRKSAALVATKYLTTNVTPDATMTLDATAMTLEDDSVDAFLCESMLEHVGQPELVVREVLRTLRPGGVLILATPWMYPYHAAPDDFLRFSQSALRNLLTGFEIVESKPVGNYWTTMATFAQLKVHPWVHHSKSERALRLLLGSPLLSVGLIFNLIGKLAKERDDFSGMFLVVARKPRRATGG